MNSPASSQMVVEINFIAPYKELEDTVSLVFSTHPYRHLLKKNLYLVDPKQLKSIKFTGDVVIARGLTAMLLKTYGIHIPLIEIPVTGYDIMKAVNHCTKQFGTRKIACIGSSNMVYGVQSIKEILGVELNSLILDDNAAVEQVIASAVQSGSEAVIGGLQVYQKARALAIPTALVELGTEAVRQVLDEAIRTVLLTRSERERAERFKTIMDYSYEGIIAVDSTGHITSFNRCAQDITNIDGERSIGKAIDSVLPRLPLAKVLASGRSELGVLLSINNAKIICNLAPIRVGRQTAGAIATFQNITKVQEMEGQIRKKTHAKGLTAKYQFSDIIGQSAAIAETIHFAQQYSKVDYNILITGETGTGKELFAQSIHNMSNRSLQPFVAVNCAAIPEQLLESELFGYAEGAFTGAMRGGKQGYFELAHGGTLFLDEVSELPIRLQGRLLRVLQEKEVMPLGASRIIPVDVRILAATNKNLKQLVAAGHFRQDLLYRLDVLRLFIPPLRQRQEDTATLITWFLQKHSRKFDKPPYRLHPDVLTMFSSYPWPGNIRELKNVCDRLALLAYEGWIEPSVVHKVMDFDEYSPPSSPRSHAVSTPAIPLANI
jgi:transcriptional regulator with PAS, ATPase and Fis domain